MRPTAGLAWLEIILFGSAIALEARVKVWDLPHVHHEPFSNSEIYPTPSYEASPTGSVSGLPIQFKEADPDRFPWMSFGEISSIDQRTDYDLGGTLRFR
jgi:hypothetical protein